MGEFQALGSGTITSLIEEVALPDVPNAALDEAQKLANRENDLKGLRPSEARRMCRLALGGEFSNLYGDDAYGSPVKIEVDPGGTASQSSDTREDWEVGTPVSLAGEGIPPRGFAVLATRYGVADKWADVSEAIRSKINGGRLDARTSDIAMPDPAPNDGKILAVVYAIDGKAGLAIVPQGRSISLPPDGPPWNSSSLEVRQIEFADQDEV